MIDFWRGFERSVEKLGGWGLSAETTQDTAKEEARLTGLIKKHGLQKHLHVIEHPEAEKGDKLDHLAEILRRYAPPHISRKYLKANSGGGAGHGSYHPNYYDDYWESIGGDLSTGRKSGSRSGDEQR